MKKIAAGMMILSLLLTSCGSGSGGTSSGSSDRQDAAMPESMVNSVAINLGADPKTLDPALNSATDGSNVINNTFEGLLRDYGNGPEPATAESYTVSEDGLVWTFKIRSDAKWSDGKPLTAGDFVYAWQRVADPALASEYGYLLTPISGSTEIQAGEADKTALGVAAPDDQTFVVTLAAPCGYFEELVCFPVLFPVRQDQADDTGIWAKDPAKAVSNGPFMLTEYRIGSHLILSRNPHYYDAENTPLDQVEMRMIVDSASTLTAFNAGEILWADRVPVDEVPSLIAEGSLNVLPYISTYYYVINQESPVEALKDVRVRRAISMAIDREAICTEVTRGGQQPAMGLVPPGLRDHEGRDFRETAGDYYLAPTAQVEEARALLAEAGYPNGEGIPELQIIYNTDEKHRGIAQAVQEMLKTNLGIRVTLMNQEWAVFQDTRTNGNYQAIARHGWTGDYSDPQTFLEMFRSLNGQPNPQSGNRYLNPEFDALVARGISSTGAERYQSFYDAEKVLIEDAYVIPVQFNVSTVLSAPGFVDWYLSPNGKLYLGRARVEV